MIRAGDRSRVHAGGAVYVEATGNTRVHTGPHVVVRRYSADCRITGTGTVLEATGLHHHASHGRALPGLTLLPPAPA